MRLVVDEAHPGTPEAAWRRSDALRRLPAVEPGHPRRLVVVAPHPDDEVLGAGGLLQSFVAAGVPIEVLAVTDGERSHPRLTGAQVEGLRDTRAHEAELALRRLGLPEPITVRLGLPDGRVADAEPQVQEALAEVGPDDLVLAPWWGDGHPDHDACGRVAWTVAEGVGARSLHYLVWAWHWADPDRDDLPWERCRRFDFDRARAARKRRGIGAFASQIRSWDPDAGDEPVLPPSVLARFQRRFEVFVERHPH